MRVETSRARRARGRSALITAFATALLMILVVSIASATFFFISSRGTRAASSYIHSQAGSIRWSEHDSATILFMIVGGDGRQRTPVEAMAIWSIDPATRSLSILSIPTNLWVTVPGYGPTRISDAYADGGARLALLTVESATHVPIPYYAVTGWSGLISLVDACNGIDISVPSENVGARVSGQLLLSGKQHMDGQMAADYARLPNPGRMERLQQVLLAIQQQGMSTNNLYRVPAIMQQASGSIATNFPYDQSQDLAAKADTVPIGHTRLASLDYADRAVTNYTTNGADVLLPDWHRIQMIAHNLFPTSGRMAPVQVLNGTGVVGQASSVAGWLRQSGVRIRGTGSAASYAFAHTQVLVRPGAGQAAYAAARAVSSLLQAPLVLNSIHTAGAAVAVVVGQDYQDLTQR